MISCADVEAALSLYRDELGFTVSDTHVEDGRLIWCLAKAGARPSLSKAGWLCYSAATVPR